MPESPRGRWFFRANLLLVAILVGYKIYLNFFEQNMVAAHTDQLQAIHSLLQKENYRFAVLGNINNSIGIFERKIIPMLNASQLDFVVSAGNAVSNGGADKYRALQLTLSRLEKPYLLTFGENEYSRLGSFRFYDQFGPYFFNLRGGDSLFLFLDGTGKTSLEWQLRWLREKLEEDSASHRFVFIGEPLLPVQRQGLLRLDDDYLMPAPQRERLRRLLEDHQVDAVFSANLPLFSRQSRGDTQHVVTGGAGGLVLNRHQSFYHYVEVAVSPEGIQMAPKRLEIGQHPFWRTVESLWFFIHSLFFVGYLNFVLLVSVLLLLAFWIRAKVFTQRRYYPDFDIDPGPWLGRPLRVAHFTNNYLPFIGGVPLSIDRLHRALKDLGHQVLVLAPSYGDQGTRQPEANRDEDVERIPSLLPFGGNGEFRLANIFSPRIARATLGFKPQLVHVHHPFWLGGVGRLLARQLRVPLVFTYHTRLEHYSHYVPLPDPLFRNLISHALVRRFANRCDAVVVPTGSAEEYLRMLGVKRTLHVQPTGIDYDAFSNPDPRALDALRRRLNPGTAKILVSIARLSEEKNIDFMLDALAELKHEGAPDFRLLMLGDGPQRQSLESKIRQLDLEDSVHLAGAVPPQEVPLYCALGDFFVFASRSETQGMVILEAMAAGLPVVAVRSSGIDDVVVEGHNGFKTALDRPQWKARVIQLLRDDEALGALSRAAQETARKHSIQAYGQAMTRIYAQVLAARSKNKDVTGI